MTTTPLFLIPLELIMMNSFRNSRVGFTLTELAYRFIPVIVERIG